MYLQEPLAGFKVTSGYLLLQISFAIQAIVFLIRYDTLDSVFRQTLTVVIIFFAICFASQAVAFIILNSKIQKKKILKVICDYVYIVASTGGIYYVLSILDEVEIASENTYQNEANWENLEKMVRTKQEIEDTTFFFTLLIIHYFMTVILAIFFLLLQTCLPSQKKVKIPKQIEESLLSNSEQNAINQEVNEGTQKKEARSEVDEDEDEEDFLNVVTPVIQKCFYRFGIMSFFSLIAYYRTGSDGLESTIEYDYWYLVQSALIFLLFVHEVTDTFISKIMPNAFFFIRHGVQAILFAVSAYTYFKSWEIEYATNGRIWAQIYFYIQVMDLILTIYNFFKSSWNGKRLVPSQAFAQDYIKKPYTFKQERDVEMTDDIYCICYLSNIFLYQKQLIEQNLLEEPDFEQDVNAVARETRQKELQEIRDNEIIINDNKTSQMFLRCLLIFTIQFLMSYFILMTFNDDNQGLTSAETLEILLIRLLCAIFLHIQVFEEINQGLRMFYYAMNQVSDVGLRNAMVAVSFMKAISSLNTEICNILLISSENNTLDIIKDFVALTIIAELDSIYALTLKNCKIRAKLEDKVFYFDRNLEKKSKETGIFYYFWYLIYVVLNKAYCSAFYYFMPFLIPFISYYVEIKKQFAAIIATDTQ